MSEPRRSRSAPTIPAPPHESLQGRPPRTDADLLREAAALLRRVRSVDTRATAAQLDRWARSLE